MWEWRGRSTQLTVTGMSCLTYCLRSTVTAENPPTLQQHCQVEVGLSLWKTWQLIQWTSSFSPIFCWTKKFKSDKFRPFFWPSPWPDPAPSGPLGGVLQTACACDFGGVTFQVDLTSWLDKLSLVNWFEERLEARVTSQLDKRKLSTWLVKFRCACQVDFSSSTCAQNTSVGHWNNLVNLEVQTFIKKVLAFL